MCAAPQAFVDAQGRLLTCGNEEALDEEGGQSGYLGLGQGVQHAPVPTPVPGLSGVRVQSVSLNDAHRCGMAMAWRWRGVAWVGVAVAWRWRAVAVACASVAWRWRCGARSDTLSSLPLLSVSRSARKAFATPGEVAHAADWATGMNWTKWRQD